MNRQPDLELVDELLREWAYFFRDRQKLNHCRSIEHRFRRSSDDADPDGWGDMDSTPKASPALCYRLPRALITHDAVQTLPKLNKWALTYGFCFPGLPKFVVLRCMKKWTGRRLNWQSYLEQLDVARFRMYTLLLVVPRGINATGLTRNENVA